MIVSERMDTYIRSMDKELPEKLREIEKEALAQYVPIIRRATADFLRLQLHQLKPKKVLEIGTAVAFSTILMLQYLPKEGKIVTIERMPERIKKARENIESMGLQNRIELLEGSALEILEKLVGKEQEEFDFIFMDAAKGQYINFLPYILKLMPVGATMISDNVLQDGDIIQSRYGVIKRNRTIHTRMREYLYKLTHMENLITTILPIGDGVAITLKIS